MEIQILQQEVWYPAVSAYGSLGPLDGGSQCRLSFRNNSTMNQMTALLLSSRGRYVYAPQGFEAAFDRGLIRLTDYEETPVLFEGGSSLREAFLAFISRHDQAPGQAIRLDSLLTRAPVYNTWIELTYKQNQQDVLAYARSLIDNGFPPGTLIIDDGWSDCYGSWRFSKERFPDPENMLRELHHLGFRVMLWLVPYVSPDSRACQALAEAGCLLLEEGQPYLLRWWNGASACLDLRREQALAYLRDQMAALMDLGVDGFKFDGGDSLYCLPQHQPDLQSHLWAKLASEYAFNEIRADFNTQGMSILERLSDKQHAWGRGGIASLIPDALALGLGGHPILSPDMIGGGEYRCFLNLKDADFDRELLLKNTAIAALMPVVQFSVNPARVWKEGVPAILGLLKQRQRLAADYAAMVAEAIHSKEPILRYLEYVFPHCGLARVHDQFMLGDKYMVAPLYEKGATERALWLPPGRWRNAKGQVLGEQHRPMKASSDELLGLFERVG